jgi:hypothetical protein
MVQSSCSGTLNANGSGDYFELFWSNESVSNITIGAPGGNGDKNLFEIMFEGN